MTEPNKGRRATIVRVTLAIVSTCIILGFAGVMAYTATQGNSQGASPAETYYGADQDAVIVDGFTLGGVPANIADALRYCKEGDNTGADVTRFRPCLNGVAVFALKGGTLTTAQAFPGYTMHVTEAGRLEYSVGSDILFVGAVRTKDAKGTWGAWQYSFDPSNEYLAHGERQIALFASNGDHRTLSNPEVKLPQGFDWATFLPLFLATKK